MSAHLCATGRTMSASLHDHAGGVASVRPFHRYTARNRCPHCDHETPCIYFDNGDSLCHRKGNPAQWTDSFIGAFWHRAADAGDTRPAPRRTPAPSAPTITPADRDTRDAVCADLLALCPLTDAQRADQRLTQAQADRYGWLPGDADSQARLIAALLTTHTREELLGVPGFCDQRGRLTIRGAGLMLPTRDLDGKIQAIDLRRAVVKDGQSRYIKLSSRTDDDPDAPSPGAPAHVAMPADGVAVPGHVGITEGVKKADAAADALGYPVISIPGIGATRAASSVLERVAGDVVVIMLDRDDPDKNDGRTVANVERARAELAALALPLGYAVRLATWNHTRAKGVDDLFARGDRFILERYHPADPDPKPTGPDASATSRAGSDVATTIRVQREALQRARATIDALTHAHTALRRLLLTEQFTESEKKMLVWTLLEKHGYSFGLPLSETFVPIYIKEEEMPLAGLSVNSFRTARQRLVKENVFLETTRAPGEQSKSGCPYKVITVNGERLHALIIGLNDDPGAQTEERRQRAEQRSEEARARSDKAHANRERQEEQARASRMALAKIGQERRHFAEEAERLSHQLTETEAEAQAMRQAAVDAQRAAQQILAQARRDTIACRGCGTLIKVDDWRCDDCRAQGTERDQYLDPSFGCKGNVQREEDRSRSSSTGYIHPKLGSNPPVSHTGRDPELNGEDLSPCNGGCGTLTPRGWTCGPCLEKPFTAAPLHIPNNAATEQGVHHGS